MHRIFRVKAYEMEHGPHFNEEHARKAVMKMKMRMVLVDHIGLQRKLLLQLVSTEYHSVVNLIVMIGLQH